MHEDPLIQHHIVPPATYVKVFAALAVLMVLTVAASYVHIPVAGGNIVLAMTIAVCKAMLIVLFFMHVKYSGHMIWVFAGGGFLWLVILIGLTVNDYIFRGDGMSPIISEYLPMLR
jgi:cytochrome c oxidase subunit IV